MSNTLNLPLFKWKHKYWYCALAASVFSTAFLALYLILSAKNVIQSPTDSNSLIMMLLSASFIMALAIAYVYKTTKEARLCKSVVKPARIKYLQWGCVALFLLISCHLILWFCAYKLGSDIPVYCAVPLSIVLGISSTICLTIYEFCFAFDVFYHKNKHEIIHDFLKNIEPPVPVEPEPEQETAETTNSTTDSKSQEVEIVE